MGIFYGDCVRFEDCRGRRRLPGGADTAIAILGEIGYFFVPVASGRPKGGHFGVRQIMRPQGIVWLLVAVCAGWPLAPTPAFSQATTVQPRITSALDESQLATLAGTLILWRGRNLTAGRPRRIFPCSAGYWCSSVAPSRKPRCKSCLTTNSR